MPRCLRCGCPNPQATPDILGLGLCTTHTHQLRAGTIGADYDPTVREHPIQEARALLDQIAAPGESLRSIGARIGVSKDVVRSIRLGRYQHLRSAAWENLLDAVADHLYATRATQAGQQLALYDCPTRPKTSRKAPRSREDAPAYAGVQLALFNPGEAA
ncbi:hypothetical protein [Corynebacterium heidelbergense]|uniref:Uncharacterized protein n=1 Tax=Corynebacterium heidelbergense TaxID=2055947 RepID=A0A364VDL6_9CORY|nr:hypothetical protein [Corynebacterium heidelbergense]RAV34739.1 hypothetical protein CWC39_01440 [Corynebacterium heidelbergense]WCZ36998.1 hypothetical protein CHEID_07325 [Corynebacterium heidelbergense]